MKNTEFFIKIIISPFKKYLTTAFKMVSDVNKTKESIGMVLL